MTSKLFPKNPAGAILMHLTRKILKILVFKSFSGSKNSKNY